MKTAEDCIKAQLNIDRLTPLQWDGILRAMHEFASQSKWIAVEERLPEEGDADEYGNVLIFRTTNENQSGLSKSIYPWKMCKHCDSDTFWQPLPPIPQPPKQ